MWIDYQAQRNILVSSKGHPFDRGSFFSMLDAIAEERNDLTWTSVDQPATERFFSPDLAQDYAAFLLYDIPGLEVSRDGRLRIHDPGAAFKADFEQLLADGKPLIFLHHAICGWPTYSRYAATIGGRYLFEPLTIDGKLHQDSGFVHNVTHHVAPVADHPITRGLEAGFDLTGELYLCEIFEKDVEPLMRCTDYAFTDGNFWSSAAAVESKGQSFSRDGWNHPSGSNLVVWVRREKNSPIVYIQGGHDAAAFESPHYRKLVGNSIDWATSPAAAAWARGGSDLMAV